MGWPPVGRDLDVLHPGGAQPVGQPRRRPRAIGRVGRDAGDAGDAQEVQELVEAGSLTRPEVRLEVGVPGGHRVRRATVRVTGAVAGPAAGWPRGGMGSVAVGARRRVAAVAVRIGHVGEELLELLRLDRLLRDQLVGQGHQPVTMGDEHLHGAVVAAVDDGAHLLVDLAGHVVRVVALLADLAAQEDQLVALAEGERPELVAHAELGDHAAGQVGRLLDVVGGAGGGVAEDEPLGGVAAEQAGDLVLELALALQVAVLRGQGHGVAEGHAAADDAHLGHRVGLGQDPLHEGVTALVVGDDRLLGVAR